MQTKCLLWLTENYTPDKGGMAQSCDRIIHNLRQNNVDVHVLHFSNKREAKGLQLLQNGSIMTINLQENIEHTLFMTHLFIQQQKAYKEITHIVAFGGNLPIFLSPILAQFLQKPLVICFRGNDFDTGVFSPKRREQLFYALQNTAAVACVSKDKCQMINALFPSLKTYYTPNGLDAKNWIALPSDKLKAKKIKENIDPNKKIIGVFGQLKIKKGLSFFLKALEKGVWHSSIHLLLIGDHIEHAVFEMLQKMQISYTTLPFLDRFELITYYWLCDIIAIPSFYDGMPNVLLEAALLKKAFIASNVAGMADVLENEKDAFLFEANNLQAAKQAISKFMHTSVQQLQEMGEYAYQKAKSQYTEEKEIQNYLTIFQNH